MEKKRQTFSKDFKAKVVLEELGEESTIQNLIVKYGLHPNQISQWKSQTIAEMSALFERPNKKYEEVHRQEEKESEFLKTIHTTVTQGLARNRQKRVPYHKSSCTTCEKEGLCWRKFNTMDTLQCASLLRETIEEYGCSAIFNTDQRSQFADVFLNVLTDNHIQVSMDAKGRASDNIKIERLWRSFKYEDIYLKGYETMRELKADVDTYLNFYNRARFHLSPDYSTPDEIHVSFQYNELECKLAVYVFTP